MQVSNERVRQLIVSGQLAAVRKSSGWLVRVDAVEARLAGLPRTGRPLDAVTAWGLMAVLDRGIAPWTLAAVKPGLPRLVRRAVRQAPAAQHWPAWLARRATPSIHRAHPGVLARLREDGRVSVGGAWAAASAGFDISPGDTLDLYVRGEAAAALREQYRTVPDPSGNLVIRCVAEAVPPTVSPTGGSPVPALVVALDLAESPDARARAAGLHHIASVADTVSGVTTTLSE